LTEEEDTLPKSALTPKEDYAVQNLVIYGAGGLGREIEALVRDVNTQERAWNFLGFIDDGKPDGTAAGGGMVLGGQAWLASITDAIAVVMGMADPTTKASLYIKLSQNPHIFFPTLVHPLAHVEPTADLGAGTVISLYCSISVDVKLGACAFFNVASQIGHDSVLGDFCSVMPHVDISGNVTVGARSLIGAGSKILQGLSIGSDAVVGIGSVVLRDVPGHCTVMGYPARVIQKG
jgi:sugar O-acyltransferase (sialic acid O-acetyltransferase NeuD family)